MDGAGRLDWFWQKNGLDRARWIAGRNGLARGKVIGSGRMDWLGQGGLALAMDRLKSSSSSSGSIPRPLLFRGQTATPGRREEGDVLGQEEEMLWGRPGSGNVLGSRLQLFPMWLLSSNWRTPIRNGTETN